jgi:GTP-binding protein HflX
MRRRHERWHVQDSLEELAQLARTAGAVVAGSLWQQIDRPENTYVGKGKLQEVKDKLQELDCTTVILDDELTPTQQERLETELQVKVIDRTALILDIFAGRAHTVEGRLQVELAQQEYLLPRLAGQWSHLERLGGGIGTRGPGETQLESDRRIVTNNILRLKERLEHVRRRRAQYRERRRSTGAQVVALVGYTNAGKSTLFNALTRAGVLAEDKLFATLDTTTRRILLPDGRPVLLSDTVGFINKLPATLVAAFRATLEELQEASLILHVVDISHPRAAELASVVDETLKELNAKDILRILVLNKLDILADRDGALAEGLSLGSGGGPAAPTVAVSAVREWGLDRLLTAIQQQLPKVHQPINVANWRTLAVEE